MPRISFFYGSRSSCSGTKARTPGRTSTPTTAARPPRSAAAPTVTPHARQCLSLWNTRAPARLRNQVVREGADLAYINGNLVIGGARCSILFKLPNGSFVTSVSPCDGSRGRWSRIRAAVDPAGVATNRNTAVGHVTETGRIVLR